MSNSVNIQKLAQRSKQASRELAAASTLDKNEVLNRLARLLDENREQIKEANEKDLAAGRENDLSAAMLDRLMLDDDRIDSMIAGLMKIIDLEDPVGEMIEQVRRPNDLKIGRQRVPLGVIGIIYESRPNVTVDAAALCLKSGNCTLLRGGSEARHSNYLLVDLIQKALHDLLPEAAVQILRDQDHSLVDEMLRQDNFIDVIIPRGGEGLIKMVAEKSTIPVIKHYKGVCHTYVSDSANLQMAEKICLNAKTQRPGVCNAMETLILHKELPDKFIQGLFQKMAEHNVELRADNELRNRISGGDFKLQPVNEDDWDAEYLDYILSVKQVESTAEAIDHVNRHGSNHSDAIITENYSEAETFLDQVDSAAVYVNASTRFTDGGEFGLGAEIGISTERLHARGPMGLRELTIPKYVIHGQGQIRS